jgi:NAD(P)-dependent dehydrogenase (short-subunit alcohol dehydrogenase family)
MESLAGKVALVTGGTRGIGRAIAERLLREGSSVAICGRKQDTVDRTAAELSGLGSIIGCAADVTREEDVRNLFACVDKKYGGLDILVNNAGQGVFAKVGEMTPDQWRHNIELNLNGAFYCAHEALQRFRSRDSGFIVNISSLAAINAFSGGAGYNASKAGMNMLTEAILLDHRHDNVRVTSIMPGSVNTEFSGPYQRPGGIDWMIAPEDVAEAVMLVLRIPSRTMITRVEMRPSRPRK